MDAENTFSKTQTPARNWTKDQLKLAFYFYCQTPFGKLHYRNPDIIRLAKLLDRTPSALAMKLVNFASLDPSITGTGRKGLSGASTLDRAIWDEFHSDWDKLTTECEAIRLKLDYVQTNDIHEEDFHLENFTGETQQRLVQQRLKQTFFRKAVLSSYQDRCCISGLSEPKLLIASHIVPWSVDKANRLNPSNGLCLSAIHDKAFDRGFITLNSELQVLVSKELLSRNDALLKSLFHNLNGKPITPPARFVPNTAFIEYHRLNIFLGE